MNSLAKNLALAALAGLLSAVAIAVAVFLFTDGADLSNVGAEGVGKLIRSMIVFPVIFMALAGGLWFIKRMESAEPRSPAKIIFGVIVGVLIVSVTVFVVLPSNTASTQLNADRPFAKSSEPTQSPSKDVTTRYMDNLETLAFCHAHHAANGNSFKSSGQKAQAIEAYNTASVFEFFVLSMITGGVQKKWFSVEQFMPVLKHVETQYPSLTFEEKEQFKELCPNAHKVFFASLNDRLKETVIANTKDRAQLYYKTKPTSLDGIIEDAEQALAREKK